jgi:hypothetical protein
MSVQGETISDEEHKKIMERGKIAEFAEEYFKSLNGNIKKLDSHTEKRTKEQMLDDAFFILMSDLSLGMKQSYFRDNFLPYYTKNCITQHNRGIIGNPYTSELALQSMKKRKNGTYYFEKDPSQPKFTLIHEHIVPKQLFYKPLIAFSKHPNFDRSFFEFLVDFFLIGVSITRTEDNMLNKEGMRDDMPPEFYDDTNHDFFLNPWARYYKLQQIGGYEELIIRKVKWADDLKSYTVVGTVDYSKYQWVLFTWLNYSVFQDSCHEWLKE